jgi:hypothetical protein
LTGRDRHPLAQSRRRGCRNWDGEKEKPRSRASDRGKVGIRTRKLRAICAFGNSQTVRFRYRDISVTRQPGDARSTSPRPCDLQPPATQPPSECVSGLKRIKPEIVAVQLDEVEGVQEYALVSAVVTDEVELAKKLGGLGIWPASPLWRQCRDRRAPR